jgi:hypothetical protein
MCFFCDIIGSHSLLLNTFRFDLDFSCTLHKLQVCVMTPAAMAAVALVASVQL